MAEIQEVLQWRHENSLEAPTGLDRCNGVMGVSWGLGALGASGETKEDHEHRTLYTAYLLHYVHRRNGRRRMKGGESRIEIADESF